MARRLAFIQPDARFFVFHRLQQRLGLALTQLAFFFRFGLEQLSFVRRFFRLGVGRSFYFTGEFFGFGRGRRRSRTFLGAFIFTLTG